MASDKNNDYRTLAILGVYLYSEAYPNAKFVIDGLKSHHDIIVSEICMPMFSQRVQLNKKRGVITKTFKAFLFLARAAYCHIYVLTRYMLHKKTDAVYIPYPAVGILLTYSFLPQFLRPRRIIADAFISLYDTIVADRKLLKRESLAAKILKYLESRAYTIPDLTTVDTEENGDHYADIFGLPSSCFRALPLATDEDAFLAAPYNAVPGKCHVVFVGTFVPLQGTDIIAGAIVKLRHREDIHFTVLGTGQTADKFSQITGDDDVVNMSWIKDWRSSDEIAKIIRSADICLGIFSDSEKADRVWPFKNYAYMSIGRPVISADTSCSRRMLSMCDYDPFILVKQASPDALVDNIVLLAESAELRKNLSVNSRKFYDEFLSNSVTINRLTDDILFSE